jgi:exonuclease SbcC
MKFHRMELEAFGVFKEKQVIDFEALGDLYLIRGDNGAGKTTVLDAICFALYGDVPGNRGEADSAKYADGRKPSLKSDYADDSVTPFVLLEFSVAGKRYRVRREPSWQPANKAKAHNPKATLQIDRNGSWESLATSAGGVGSILVGKKAGRGKDAEPGLLGLTLDQFSMTVMLPQGRFSQFIQASSDERSQILKAIFPVGFYDRITRRLLDNAKTLRDDLQSQSEQLERQFSHFCGLIGLEDIQLPDDIADWLKKQQAATDDALKAARGALALADTRLERANLTLAQDRAANETVAARQAAEAKLKSANDATASIESGLKALDLTVTAFSDPEIGQKLANTLKAVEEQLEVLKSRADMQETLDELNESLEAIGPNSDALLMEIVAAKAAVAEAKQAKIDLAELKTSSATLEHSIDKSRQIKALVDEILELDTEEVPLKSNIDDFEAELAKAKSAVANLQADREDSAAARLAEKLAKGKACAVCGSKEHPKHATYAGVIPTEKMFTTAEAKVTKAESAKQKALDAWTTHHATKDEKNRTLKSVHKIKTLQEAQALITALPSQEEKLKEQQLAESALVKLAGGITKLESHLSKKEGELKKLNDEKLRLQTELTAKQSELKATKLVARLSKDVDELENQQAQLEAKLKFINESSDNWQELQRQKVAAIRELEALPAAGKDNAAALQKAKTEAAAALTAQNEASTGVVNLEGALREIGKVQHFPDLEQSLVKIRAELEVAEVIAETANGRRGKYVPLTNFYLGERLRQITALASERWMKISDNRFRLEHVESVTKGTAKSGLELLYVDTWSGAKRPVGSLCGGELFMASISLALALSDVVKNESGSSVSLDTLFVDEGFGSLDAEHGESVVSVLEGLRLYGRTVCLVSHVPAIQERIPVQLQIQKSKSGSKILAHTFK